MNPTYLLDTNVVSHIMQGRDKHLRNIEPEFQRQTHSLTAAPGRWRRHRAYALR